MSRARIRPGRRLGHPDAYSVPYLLFRIAEAMTLQPRIHQTFWRKSDLSVEAERLRSGAATAPALPLMRADLSDSGYDRVLRFDPAFDRRDLGARCTPEV
jgi:hypothetical protein